MYWTKKAGGRVGRDVHKPAMPKSQEGRLWLCRATTARGGYWYTRTRSCGDDAHAATLAQRSAQLVLWRVRLLRRPCFVLCRNLLRAERRRPARAAHVAPPRLVCADGHVPVDRNRGEADDLRAPIHRLQLVPGIKKPSH
jgi:hypothetical protein